MPAELALIQSSLRHSAQGPFSEFPSPLLPMTCHETFVLVLGTSLNSVLEFCTALDKELLPYCKSD